MATDRIKHSFTLSGSDGVDAVTKPGIYEGRVLNGVPHGEGTFTYETTTFTGTFVHGTMTGQGKQVYRYDDGAVKTTYEGELRDYLPHGYGEVKSFFYYDTPTQHYVGEFRDGQMHGQGKYTRNISYKNKKGGLYFQTEISEGEFKNGSLVRGTITDDKGNQQVVDINKPKPFEARGFPRRDIKYRVEDGRLSITKMFGASSRTEVSLNGVDLKRDWGIIAGTVTVITPQHSYTCKTPDSKKLLQALLEHQSYIQNPNTDYGL